MLFCGLENGIRNFRAIQIHINPLHNDSPLNLDKRWYVSYEVEYTYMPIVVVNILNSIICPASQKMIRQDAHIFTLQKTIISQFPLNHASNTIN